jgi:DNA (cytosine-5)-methyltransferase 1
MGYAQAGFEVTGVDIHRRQCGYPPGELIVADVTELLTEPDWLRSFDLIHAGPPCQVFTRAGHLRTAQGKQTTKLDLIGITREALLRSSVPFVIENVEGAPIRPDLKLCGSFFPELSVTDSLGRRWLQRHRIFEFGNGAKVPFQPRCRHNAGRRIPQVRYRPAAGDRPLGVYHKLDDAIPSGGQTAADLAQARAVMGIDWMSFEALVEAIPPAYTRYIGRTVIAGRSATAASPDRPPRADRTTAPLSPLSDAP